MKVKKMTFLSDQARITLQDLEFETLTHGNIDAIEAHHQKLLKKLENTKESRLIKYDLSRKKYVFDKSKFKKRKKKRGI